jgi:menaquinone-specific isochorismate synthase
MSPLPAPVAIKVLKKQYLPTREEWIQNVEKALEKIERKELQKVVLARSCTLELAATPDPFALTAALQRKAEGAFVFCLQSENEAFFGATPELLFSRKGQDITSEAVAGTRPRGRNVEEEAHLQKELLASAKDLREFSPIPLYLQTTLSPLCLSPLVFSPLSIHTTQNVQHLYSKCSGKLKANVTDDEIIQQLHPTPALCGSPKEKAASLIAELEPFSRGLYGGILGWSTPNASEWIVGIRSCLLQGNKAILYSGTGIVEGSDPEKEWDELNQKLNLYDGILDY